VDALNSGGAPGLVRRFTMDEIGSPDDEYSLHQLGVNHLLAAVTAAFAGRVPPEVVVIGAEIGEIDPFTNRLSRALEAALETVVELVALECAN
jgi:hydrogenase maturation protease